MTNSSRHGRRRCRICKRPEGSSHKLSCDYTRYPSQYPAGPDWEAVPPASSPPVAECPVCERDYRVTSEGRLFRHFGAGWASTGMPCDGTGEAPSAGSPA